MSTSSSPVFTGTSSFSSDFAQVISRAVSIASLPMNQLTNTVTSLAGEQTSLSSLSTTFNTLQSAVSALDTAASSGNYAVSSSLTSVATASASSGALLGTYSLEVDNAGSQSTAASTATVTNPATQSISTAATYTLIANGQQYTIVPPPTSTTLDSLVTAINSSTLGAVQATVVNIGTLSQPSFELSLQSNAFSSSAITLDDGTGNILGATSAGSAIQYRVNGQPAAPADPLTSDSQALTISPNLTARVTGTGTTSIKVGQSTSGIANALTNFVAAYNAATAAVAGQRGQSGGSLGGQGVVSQLSQALQNLTNYTGTGSIHSMADLGLTFNTSGVVAFDSTVLASSASSDFQGVVSFLGSSAGSGFLQAATNTMSSVMDSSAGTIPIEQTALAAQITTDTNKIASDQNVINTIQTNLTNQLDSADALIAEMQQQYTYMSELFVSMTSSAAAGR